MPERTHETRLGWRMAADRAEVFLYDEFDEMWGITERDVTGALADLDDAAELRVHISSPGGSTDIGVGIMSAVSRAKNRFNRVVAVVDGAAYSAATLPALPAHETIMMPGALWYVHRPMSVVGGNAEELLDAAGVLERLQGTVAGLYAKRTGETSDTMNDAMIGPSGNGTYYTAEETVAAGFADRVEETIAVSRRTEPEMFFSRSGFRDMPGTAPTPVRAAMRTAPYLNHFLQLPRDADPRHQATARAMLGRLTRF